MFGYRRRSPLLWRLLKTAAAGYVLHRMIRTPDAAGGQRARATREGNRLKANAERALALKTGSPKPWRPESRTANEGMHSTPNRNLAPSGAFGAEGSRPALERSHGAR